MKIALIYCSYDGIINSYCGVGAVTQSFLMSFDKLRNYFKEHKTTVELHLITPALLDSSLGYDRQIRAASESLARATGGNIHYVINGTNGNVPYGDIKNWEIISSCAASKILEISNLYTKSIVYCLDTPFMKVPHNVNIQQAAFNKNTIEFITVLHSDVYLHEAQKSPSDRIGWELINIEYLKRTSNVYIAKTSDFLMEHLKKIYNIPHEKIVDLQTGIFPASRRYEIKTQKQVKHILEKYKIPINKPLIFSFGRAVNYKGFDVLIKALALVKSEYHLVLIASPYKTEKSNVAELRKLLRQKEIPCTEIYRLDFDLPKYVCQWHLTKIVATLSKSEPFGLIPEEVRMWAKKHGPVILASAKDGFVEQITDGVDGYLVTIDDIRKISVKIEKILKLTEEKIDCIRTNGYYRAINCYNYCKSVRNSIHKFISIS